MVVGPVVAVAYGGRSTWVPSSVEDCGHLKPWPYKGLLVGSRESRIGIPQLLAAVSVTALVWIQEVGIS